MIDYSYGANGIFVTLRWTTKPPTQEGWYCAFRDEEVMLVEVFRHTEKGSLFVRSGWDTNDFFEFSHWMGPLPEPKRPEPKAT